MPKGKPINVYPDAAISYIPMIQYNTINCGKTPAIIGESFVDLRVMSNLPSNPPFGEWKELGDSILAADDQTSPAIVTMGDGLSEQHFSAQDWHDIRNGKKFFLFFGRIKYKSIYGTEHETRWAYRWYVEGFRAYFAAVGGDAYNKRT